MAEVESTPFITMSVKQILLDPRNQTPIVILQSDSEDENRGLPIWIGPYEASSIIMAIEKVKFPRPLTHDLILSAIRGLGGELKEVRIHDVQEATFFAQLVIALADRVVPVDSRPSDSIAVALRAECPILVRSDIAETPEKIEEFLNEAQAEQYRSFLENLDPEDISKYKM